jgi:hypothetical protein
MFILTAADAEKVRGLSPSDRRAALDPILLQDGTFMLGEEVANDPAHADVSDLLKSMAIRDVPASEVAAARDARVPLWSDVGVRKGVEAGGVGVPKTLVGRATQFVSDGVAKLMSFFRA